MQQLHRWNLTPKQAVALQGRLADYVRTDRTLFDPVWVAGVDVSHNRRTGRSRAAVVVLRFPELEPTEMVTEEQSFERHSLCSAGFPEAWTVGQASRQASRLSFGGPLGINDRSRDGRATAIRN